ncbi:MarR family transcriptional regulator [Pseudonocardia xinjiangensis]|uniref:MarR family transcriptional regulator n=1 Tax=Pseudonocardia xinjiangensis TaxID=75289 RepID=A0ABX1RJS2_9PSEU|nr:MarR family transcriptional regulator [Pseudonocardia xinjiangensis]
MSTPPPKTDPSPPEAAGFPGPSQISYLLARAGGQVVRHLNRELQPHGLRSRHYSVLVLAAVSVGRTQRELSITLGIDPSGIVAIVDDLEREGLVRREASVGDRRTRLVVTTDAGRRRLAEAEPAARRLDETLLVALDDPEREVLRRLLLRLVVD